MQGSFSFQDGLDYTQTKTGQWKYCQPPNNRKFYTEVLNGVCDPIQLTNNVDTPTIPRGTFDVGNGYYDPETGKVHEYGTKESDFRGPVSRDVEQNFRNGLSEGEWAVQYCRVGV